MRTRSFLQRVARDNDAIVVGLESCELIDSTGIAFFLQRQLERKRRAPRPLRLLGAGAAGVHRRRLTDGGIVFDGRGEAIAELASVG